DPVLRYLEAWQRFDPTRSSLWTYLCMIADTDALDLIRTRSSRSQLLKDHSDVVELWSARPNSARETEATIDAEVLLRRFGSVLAVNDAEREVLRLLIEGERATEAFAVALGLDPTAGDTRKLVKMAKD